MSAPAPSGPSPILVRDWMTRDPISVSPGDDVARAYRLLAEHRIRHLPVVSAKGRLAGILTKRDLLALTRAGRQSSEGSMTVAVVMNPEPLTLPPDAPLRRAAELLAHHKYGCIPVVDERRSVVGIVTEHDFVRWFLAQA